jgi:type IV pilus assembly protein PilZ
VKENESDRRYHVRAPIELKVEYKRLNSFFADYTRNISRGGTFIRTTKPLGIGTEFVFRLTVPTMGEPLVLRGKVQWVVQPEDATGDQEPGMGIGFIFASEADRQRIESVVERLMVDSLGPVLHEKIMKRRDP